MLASLLPIFAATLLGSCKERAMVKPMPSSGRLVCADRMALIPAPSQPASDTGLIIDVENCPLLAAGDSIVEKDGAYLRVIDQNGAYGLVKKDSARVIGVFEFPRPFAAFTSTLVPAMVETPRAGVLTQVDRRGLVFANDSGVDTLYPDRTDKPYLSAGPETTAQACAEKLRGSDVRGLIGGFLLPGIDCRFEVEDSWIWGKDENGLVALTKESQSIRVERLLSIARDKAFPLAFWAEFSSSEGRLWLFSSHPDSLTFVLPRLEYLPAVEKVGLSLLDADSLADFIVEAHHYYGDGRYAQLGILNSVGQGGLPVLLILPLSGSSGEEGGQTLEGAWCVERSGPGTVLYVIRQEDEGQEFRAAQYTLGKKGFGLRHGTKPVFGSALTDPNTRDSTLALASRWKRHAGSHLCLVPMPQENRWFVGKLFAESGERKQWVSGLKASMKKPPADFELELIRKVQ